MSLTLETPPPLELPADLSAALDAQAGARHIFEALAPSRRRELVRQLEDAKTQETRDRRREKLLAQLAAP